MKKRNNIFYVASRVGGIALFALVTLLLNVTFAVAAGAYVATVGAVVTGEAITGDVLTQKNSELNLDYISQKVVEMKPAATPLDTIMRQVKSVPIKSWKTEYYAVDTRPMTDKLDAAYSRVDSTNYDHTAELTVEDVQMWAIDDTVLFPTVSVTSVDGKIGPLMGVVVGKTVASNKIGVQVVNGITGAGNNANRATGCYPASIADETLIVRMGTAKGEKDAQTSPFGMIPDKAYNYCQIFMAQCEESLYQRIHEKEVDWSFSDYEAQNIYDMRASMEASFILGARGYFADATLGKYRHFTGGVARYITKDLTYTSGSIDDATFVTWSKSIFTGNSGSETRILFAGDDLLKDLSLVSTVQKQIDAKSTFVKWGLTFKEIETNFGSLLIFHHKLLNQMGWSKRGIVLDINNVEKHVFKPMQANKLDLKGSGQSNVNATMIDEASCLVLRYPDTHAIIRPAS